MPKIVINKQFGGFGLSPEALLWLWRNGYKQKGFITPVREYFGKRNDDSFLGLKKNLEKWRSYLGGEKQSVFLTTFTPDEKFVLSGDSDIKRDHPLLLKCLKELGEKANGDCATLKVVTIPKGIKWHIEEYHGLEHVAEDHRTWD